MAVFKASCIDSASASSVDTVTLLILLALQAMGAAFPVVLFARKMTYAPTEPSLSFMFPWLASEKVQISIIIIIYFYCNI